MELTNGPQSIELESMSKLFEYERQARIIDECEDVRELKKYL